MQIPEQFPIPFEHRPAHGLDDFLVAPSNADAVAWIDRWPDWPGPALVITGAEGAGKTHLVSVFLSITGGRALSPGQVAGERPDTLTEGARALVIDGLDRMLGENPELEPALEPELEPELEEAVLHLYNLANEAGIKLLLTAQSPPARWRIGLKDLSSRLNAAPVATISPPDDSLLAALLVKQFSDRQIVVGQEVVAYMVSHMSRSFIGARRLVQQVDQLAMSEKRAITIPLVRRVLGDLPADESA